MTVMKLKVKWTKLTVSGGREREREATGRSGASGNQRKDSLYRVGIWLFHIA
jgi:hypothetical protein